MRTLFAVLFLGMLTNISWASPKADAVKIEYSIRDYVQNYPVSTLKDIYKNFFQDRFGPGHLIQDTAQAKKYLQTELAQMKNNQEPYFEKTGWQGNFYRVNLRVVKENLISFDAFFESFYNSALQTKFPPVAEWRAEWNEILRIMNQMGMCLSDFMTDNEEINNLLKANKYVVHHSPIFEQEYDPHYRIIKRDIFEKEILPLLPR